MDIFSLLAEWAFFAVALPPTILGLFMVTDEAKAFKGARVCFWLSAIWMWGKILWWGANTPDRFLARSIAIFIACGVIAIALSEALRLTARREAHHAVKPAEEAETHLPTDIPHVQTSIVLDSVTSERVTYHIHLVNGQIPITNVKMSSQTPSIGYKEIDTGKRDLFPGAQLDAAGLPAVFHKNVATPFYLLLQYKANQKDYSAVSAFLVTPTKPTTIFPDSIDEHEGMLETDAQKRANSAELFKSYPLGSIAMTIPDKGPNGEPNKGYFADDHKMLAFDTTKGLVVLEAKMPRELLRLEGKMKAQENHRIVATWDFNRQQIQLAVDAGKLQKLTAKRR